MALSSSNISTTLVRNTLVASTNDVGSLCTHPNINKWSRWKPVKYSKVVGLTEENMEAAFYGMRFLEFSPEYTNNALSNSVLYIKPIGGDESPYRLGDFRTYEHNAIPSFHPGLLPLSVNTAVTQNVVWGIYKNPAVGNAPLELGEISWNGLPPSGSSGVKPKNLRVGVEIRSSSGVVSTQYTSAALEEIDSIPVNLSTLQPGTYTLHLFLFFDGYPNRRFPFPSYDAYPNHKTMGITYDYGFTITPVQAYRMRGTSSYTISDSGTNNITDAADTTDTRLVVKISATGALNINLKQFYLMHNDNVLFYAPTTANTYGWAVSNQTSGVTVDANMNAYIPSGGSLNLELRCQVSLKPDGHMYANPYSVFYYLQHNGKDILSKETIWKNV